MFRSRPVVLLKFVPISPIYANPVGIRRVVATGIRFSVCKCNYKSYHVQLLLLQKGDLVPAQFDKPVIFHLLQ